MVGSLAEVPELTDGPQLVTQDLRLQRRQLSTFRITDIDAEVSREAVTPGCSARFL